LTGDMVNCKGVVCCVPQVLKPGSVDSAISKSAVLSMQYHAVLDLRCCVHMRRAGAQAWVCQRCRHVHVSGGSNVQLESRHMPEHRRWNGGKHHSRATTTGESMRSSRCSHWQ
jgi:hypothetical protein